MFGVFATFFEKKGGAKKLSKRKVFMMLHNLLGLCVCRVRAFIVSLC